MCSFESKQWYAVQTRSNLERRVVTELSVNGFTTYYPTVLERRQRSDRKVNVARPLFPGYVFVNFRDSSESRLRIVKIAGAVRILGTLQDVEPIPDNEIESIKQMLACRKSCFAHPFLTEGAWVRIRRGVLRGIEGRLVRVKNEFRLVLAITLLSQSIATEIDLQDVQFLRHA